MFLDMASDAVLRIGECSVPISRYVTVLSSSVLRDLFTSEGVTFELDAQNRAIVPLPRDMELTPVKTAIDYIHGIRPLETFSTPEAFEFLWRGMEYLGCAITDEVVARYSNVIWAHADVGVLVEHAGKYLYWRTPPSDRSKFFRRLAYLRPQWILFEVLIKEFLENHVPPSDAKRFRMEAYMEMREYFPPALVLETLTDTYDDLVELVNVPDTGNSFHPFEIGQVFRLLHKRAPSSLPEAGVYRAMVDSQKTFHTVPHASIWGSIIMYERSPTCSAFLKISVPITRTRVVRMAAWLELRIEYDPQRRTLVPEVTVVVHHTKMDAMAARSKAVNMRMLLMDTRGRSYDVMYGWLLRDLLVLPLSTKKEDPIRRAPTQTIGSPEVVREWVADGRLEYIRLDFFYDDHTYCFLNWMLL